MSRLIGGRTPDAQDQLVCSCRFDLAGVGTWAASTTVNTESVAATAANGIEPLQVMTRANELPAVHYADYTFVFN